MKFAIVNSLFRAGRSGWLLTENVRVQLYNTNCDKRALERECSNAICEAIRSSDLSGGTYGQGANADADRRGPKRRNDTMDYSLQRSGIGGDNTDKLHHYERRQFNKLHQFNNRGKTRFEHTYQSCASGCDDPYA